MKTWAGRPDLVFKVRDGLSEEITFEQLWKGRQEERKEERKKGGGNPNKFKGIPSREKSIAKNPESEETMS